MIWRAPVALVNGRVHTPAGVAASVRFDTAILDIDAAPQRRDVVIDLEGAWVLPGLVNAHDHLELNHYGPQGRRRDRAPYTNAAAWVDDMRPRLNRDPDIRRGRQYPLAERLFAGGLKNLLAGTTLVAHHNPFYAGIERAAVVRVLRKYGWAHSFGMEHAPVGASGEPGGVVWRRFDHTRHDRPFIVHLAEGVDAAARAELAELRARGCLAANTVLVHGVGLTTADWSDVASAGAALVWCPSSNQHLLGRTVDVRPLLDDARMAARIALGSDSRLTGERDLLDELRAAAALSNASPDELLRMVTSHAAAVLRASAGALVVGRPADLLVLPARAGTAAEALLAATRADVAAVAIAGRPLVADAPFARWFAARRTATRPLTVDAREKLAMARLVARIEACPIVEPGVSVQQARRYWDAAS